MKEQHKKREFDDRSKRLMVYLAFLVGAAFLAFSGQGNAWLAIGISAGILISLFVDMNHRRRERKKPPEVSTEITETVENKDDQQ